MGLNAESARRFGALVGTMLNASSMLAVASRSTSLQTAPCFGILQ